MSLTSLFRHLKILSALLFLSPAALQASPAPSETSEKPTLLVIFIDGARWDLIDLEATPNLNRLARSGARGEVIPVWPTYSHPNHTALATGLYPNHSGTYHNSMYNPATGAYFKKGDAIKWGGEPIWSTVSRQGGISGVIRLWGNLGHLDLPNSQKPSFFLPFTSRDESCSGCAEIVLDLLGQAPVTRPQFLSLYFWELDHNQHEHGVGSPEAKNAVAMIDGVVGRILDGLRARKLDGKVNIVLVADHGHQNIAGTEKSIVISDYVSMDDLVVVPEDGGAVLALWPKPGREDQVYERVKSINPDARAYRGNAIPARWHCCSTDGRTPPIILEADSGWSISARPEEAKKYADIKLKSTHGFDNQMREMHALFLASGPGIKQGSNLGVFENVNIYSLMAELLKVEPVATDGSLKPFCNALSVRSTRCDSGQ